MEAQKVKNEGSKDQQQQHHLFTLEHPFADHVFYDDDDYVEEQNGW